MEQKIRANVMIKEHPINVFFIDREDLKRSLGNPQQDGRVLVAGSPKFISFYDPKKDRIIVELKGKIINDFVGAELEFLNLAEERKKLEIKKEIRVAKERLRELVH